MSSFKKNPLISIGIPTYNRSEKLFRCLESTINQDYENIEIIVCDNNSNDNTSQVVLSFNDKRIHYHQNDKNIGMRNNFNMCLNKSSGDFFILLSDDDIPKNNLVSCLFNKISKNIDNIFAYSCVEFHRNGIFSNDLSQIAPTEETGRNFLKNNLLGKRAAFPSATIVQTKDAVAVGGYPDVDAATDFGLLTLLCLRNNGMVTFNQRPLVEYHDHGENLSYKDVYVDALGKLIQWMKVTLKNDPNLLKLALNKYKKELLSIYRANMLKKDNNLMKKASGIYKMNFYSLSDEILFALSTNAYLVKIYNFLLK